MIGIDFHQQSALVHNLVENLTGPHPSCWDVVLPPGFGEERFARQLETELRQHQRRLRVAVQGADHTNPTIGEFVRALHWQWGETKDPPKPLDRSASIYLDLLLESLRADDRAIVLVIKRFHKALDNLEKWVLGKLRQEEQNKRLHTVIISPIPLACLKKRWETRNHYFSTSDYGDSRHMPVTVAAPGLDELERQCTALDVPSAVVAYVRQITGGYPDNCASLLEWWLNNNRQNLTPGIRSEMLTIARGQLAGFVEWLDPLEDGVYRDYAIDLYHGVDTENALDAFQNHPWRDVVLEADGLRAEAVGAKALDAALELNANRKTSHSKWYDVAKRAYRLYGRRQYDAALGVLDSIEKDRLRPHERVLQAHSRIMAELAGEQGDNRFGTVTDYRRLRQALGSARDLLMNIGLSLPPADRAKVEGRYRELEEVAAAITAAAGVTGPFQNRLVDVLAGFAGPEHMNAKGAALVLLLRSEAGKSIAGDGTACQFLLALPEQIFRTWALWVLDLNYYRAPEPDEPVWEIVDHHWPRSHGSAQRTAPGMPFPSFYVFAYYALASLRSRFRDRQSHPPEVGFKELESGLSMFESVRTGHAHGVYVPTKRQRQAYAALVDRWLTSLLSADPGIGSRQELLELTEPLPLVNADGTVSW